MGSNAGGFSFDLCKRNAFLQERGVKPPAAWKTGTTIAGIVFKVLLVFQGAQAVEELTDLDVYSICVIDGLSGLRGDGPSLC
jgi:hypothetical protein